MSKRAYVDSIPLLREMTSGAGCRRQPAQSFYPTEYRNNTRIPELHRLRTKDSKLIT